MKNYLRNPVLLLMVVLAFTISCSHNEFLTPVQISDQPALVIEAKTWIEGFLSQSRNLNQPYAKQEFLWKQAVVKQLPNKAFYVQIPLKEPLNEKHIVFDPVTKMQVPAPSLQIIVYRDQKKELQMMVMELSPDGDYAGSHQGFTGDNDFSGIQLLRNWSGQLIGGNRFEKGKLVGRVIPIQTDSRARKMQPCEQWLRQYISIGCTNYFHEATVVGTVLYYRLGTFQMNPRRPSELAPGSYLDCDDWQNIGGPEQFQICAPDPNYDPFSPSYPSNPSDPFNPLTGSGATALLELYNNKKALFGPCPGLTDSWSSLINFRPSSQIIDKLKRISTYGPFNQGIYSAYPSVNQGYYVQAISSAVGTAINLDNFSVYMDDLPIIDGHRLTVSEFAEYIRLHINDFIDTSIKTFAPHSGTGENEVGLWESTNALGAVILISIPGDPGSVIVTEHNTGGSSSAGWTFSTIHDAFVQDHPVSGTRTFSIYATSGGYMFTTQGADRLTNYAGYLAQASLGIPFDQADALWTSMQTKMAQFVASHQANPQIIAPVKNRPLWNDVKQAINENRSLSTLPCPGD